MAETKPSRRALRREKLAAAVTAAEELSPAIQSGKVVVQVVGDKVIIKKSKERA